MNNEMIDGIINRIKEEFDIRIIFEEFVNINEGKTAPEKIYPIFNIFTNINCIDDENLHKQVQAISLTSAKSLGFDPRLIMDNYDYTLCRTNNGYRFCGHVVALYSLISLIKHND